MNAPLPQPQAAPGEDERVLAALAHAGVVVNAANLAGIFAAALIWATQREKSAYVRAHALQALVYQAVATVLGIIMALAWGGCLMLSLLPAILRPELYRASPPSLFWLILALGVVPLAYAVVAVGYGLVGVVQAYRGRPFRYPLLGRLVAPPAAPSPPPPPTPPAPPLPVLASAPDITPPVEPVATNDGVVEDSARTQS